MASDHGRGPTPGSAEPLLPAHPVSRTPSFHSFGVPFVCHSPCARRASPTAVAPWSSGHSAPNDRIAVAAGPAGPEGATLPCFRRSSRRPGTAVRATVPAAGIFLPRRRVGPPSAPACRWPMPEPVPPASERACPQAPGPRPRPGPRWARRLTKACSALGPVAAAPRTDAGPAGQAGGRTGREERSVPARKPLVIRARRPAPMHRSRSTGSARRAVPSRQLDPGLRSRRRIRRSTRGPRIRRDADSPGRTGPRLARRGTPSQRFVGERIRTPFRFDPAGRRGSPSTAGLDPLRQRGGVAVATAVPAPRGFPLRCGPRPTAPSRAVRPAPCCAPSRRYGRRTIPETDPFESSEPVSSIAAYLPAAAGAAARAAHTPRRRHRQQPRPTPGPAAQPRSVVRQRITRPANRHDRRITDPAAPPSRASRRCASRPGSSAASPGTSGLPHRAVPPPLYPRVAWNVGRCARPVGHSGSLAGRPAPQPTPIARAHRRPPGARLPASRQPICGSRRPCVIPGALVVVLSGPAGIAPDDCPFRRNGGSREPVCSPLEAAGWEQPAVTGTSLRSFPGAATLSARPQPTPLCPAMPGGRDAVRAGFGCGPSRALVRRAAYSGGERAAAAAIGSGSLR